MSSLRKVIAAFLVNSLEEKSLSGDASESTDPAEAKEPKPSTKPKYELHQIKIAFDAPDPTDPTAETYGKSKDTGYDPNFRWKLYNILFTREPGKADGWYIYQAEMDPWGTIQTTKKAGVPTIIKSDSLWGMHKNIPVDISPKEVEPFFDVIEQSNGKKEGQPWIHNKNVVGYFNQNEKSKRKSPYSSAQFKQYFDKDFYQVLTEGKKFVNPFDSHLNPKKPLGQTGEQPMEEEKVVQALRQGMRKASKEAYFTGGFDAMKKLYKEQQKNPGKAVGLGEGPETGDEPESKKTEK